MHFFYLDVVQICLSLSLCNTSHLSKLWKGFCLRYLSYWSAVLERLSGISSVCVCVRKCAHVCTYFTPAFSTTWLGVLWGPAVIYQWSALLILCSVAEGCISLWHAWCLRVRSPFSSHEHLWPRETWFHPANANRAGRSKADWAHLCSRRESFLNRHLTRKQEQINMSDAQPPSVTGCCLEVLSGQCLYEQEIHTTSKSLITNLYCQK